MKKLLCIAMAIVMMFSFSACSESSDDSIDSEAATDNDLDYAISTESEPDTYTDSDSNSDVTYEKATGDIDVDLTVLSSTMVYSEVYNMLVNSDEYIGKIVKMTGIFGVYEDSSTGNMYFAILIMDATACCTQGIEFILADASYPDDYPEIGETATVIGEFQTYDEYGTEYVNLVGAYLV